MNRIPLVALQIGLATAFAGPPISRHEIAAIFRLANQRTGTYREVEVVSANRATETMLDSDLVFNRLGSKLEVKTVAHYFETGDGRLIRVTADLTSSAQTTHVEAIVEDAAIAISTSTGGRTYNRKLTYNGALIGPHAVRGFVLKHLRQPGDTVRYQTFLAEFGSLATVSDKLVAIGGPTQGLKLEQTFSSVAGKSTLWLDRQGWMLSQSMPSPLGEITAIRSKGLATKAVTNWAELPKESFTSSIITSNVRLPKERLIEEVKLKITQKRPDLGWPDFSAPNQKVLSKTVRTLVLQVTRPQPDLSAKRLSGGTEELRPFLAPNALMQSDDPTVKAIAAKVVPKTDNAWKTARTLQRWINDNMHFDSGVAITSASEVAKNRGGTCFGYSMLLGSLLRAAGVPSRLRMGFVYAGGIWGGHAWVDVLIGKEWIPIDGALYAPGAADAARFSCFTSSLQENAISNMSSMAQLFGNIDVKILEFKVGGKRITVPSAAQPYMVKGDTFSNPWLGVSVTKPADLHFTAFNLTWPLATVVAMKGPGGQRIELENESASLPTGSQDEAKTITDPALRMHARPQTVGGRRLLLAGSRTKAVAVLHGNGSLWLIEASGPSAEKNVIRMARSLRLAD